LDARTFEKGCLASLRECSRRKQGHAIARTGDGSRTVKTKKVRVLGNAHSFAKLSEAGRPRRVDLAALISSEGTRRTD
jgi:hypothetical protein